MTRDTRQTAQRWAVFLLTALAIPLASWAFARYDNSLMKVPRFVQDSSVIMDRDASFKAAVFDRLDRLQRGQDSIALRLSQSLCGRRVENGCR